MTVDLPDGWVREFEGRHGAEYFHEPRVVSVQVLPRYDPPGGRASQSSPTRYLVRLQRPYSDHVGFPVEVATVDDFGAALATAREFMVGFSDRYARSGSRDPAVDALSAVAGYSDDRLVDVLVDRTGDALRAVVHADPDPVPVYGAEVGGTVAGLDLGELLDAVRTAGDDVGRLCPGGLRATVTLLEAVTVLWIPAGEDRGTAVALDADAELSLPGIVEECAELLSERESP